MRIEMSYFWDWFTKVMKPISENCQIYHKKRPFSLTSNQYQDEVAKELNIMCNGHALIHC